MTVTQMKYFEAVCHHKNVTKAANELYVARSAVSRSLKELEDELCVALFKRSNTGVELTESGKMLRNIFAEFNGAYETLKERLKNDGTVGTVQELRIGITTTTGSRFYPDFFAGFINAHPDIRVRVIEKPAYECQDAILSGEINFFITPHFEDTLSSKISSMPVYNSEMLFCVSASSELARRKSITINEIIGIDRVSLLTPLPTDIQSGEHLGSVIDFAEEAEVIIKTSQQDLIRKAVESGIAASILPRDMVEGWSGVSAVPFDPAFTISVNIIWCKALPRSKAFDAFMDYISEYNFSEL